MIASLLTFKDRLVWARERVQMSQAELARRVGIQQSTLSGYESGNRGLRTMPKKTFQIAKVLGVRAEWLWTGSGSPDESDIEKAISYLRNMPPDRQETAIKVLMAMSGQPLESKKNKKAA